MEVENFHIKLEARNPEKGHFRAYSIDAGQDMFGHWNIEVHFGRIGRRGRSVTYSAADDAAAAAIIQHCLRRRVTAPKRIGVHYSVRELIDPRGLSAMYVSNSGWH
ncbi:MAG: WGR domain-containing protein [Nitrospira sp.]|nr:WGR domain-containing protein [Nitrospira sp.]